ncbi:hypothetical protein SNEBB_004821 [Seison nebaliae]|nr:hypothetical protein SNEBB_004821 [Seison nebaliae]
MKNQKTRTEISQEHRTKSWNMPKNTKLGTKPEGLIISEELEASEDNEESEEDSDGNISGTPNEIMEHAEEYQAVSKVTKEWLWLAAEEEGRNRPEGLIISEELEASEDNEESEEDSDGNISGTPNEIMEHAEEYQAEEEENTDNLQEESRPQRTARKKKHKNLNDDWDYYY